MLYVVAAVALLIIIFLIGKESATNDIHKRFNLSPSTYNLVSTDLGNNTPLMKLYAQGVAGIPDAVFHNRKRQEIVVGEFKSRKYGGHVRLVELYQLTLYMGLIKAKYPDCSVKGCMAYADDAVPIAFDSGLYEALMDMRSEYREARAGQKPASRGKPLHQRMRVNGANRRVKFSAALRK